MIARIARRFFLVGDVGGGIALRGIELPGTRRGGGENGQRECRKLSFA